MKFLTVAFLSLLIVEDAAVSSSSMTLFSFMSCARVWALVSNEFFVVFVFCTVFFTYIVLFSETMGGIIYILDLTHPSAAKDRKPFLYKDASAESRSVLLTTFPYQLISVILRTVRFGRPFYEHSSWTPEA